METPICYEFNMNRGLDQVLCDCLRAFGYMRWCVRYTTTRCYRNPLSFAKVRRGLLAASKPGGIDETQRTEDLLWRRDKQGTG